MIDIGTVFSNIKNLIVGTEISAIKNENQVLKEKIKEMKDNPLRYDGSMYRDNDNFPYCPACYDARDLRIHLNNSSNKICFHCPECNNNFFEK